MEFKLNYQNFVDSLDEKTIKKLQSAVELGRWENGEKLSQKQRDSALQAVLLWKAKHEVTDLEQPFRVNQKGEFKVGKGEKLDDVPIEFKSELDKSIIIKSKG